MENKAVSIMGFAQKAGKIIYGADAIERVGRKVKLIIFDSSISSGTLNKLKGKTDAAMLKSLFSLEDLLHKPGCKVAAITDKQMAEAILKYKNDVFMLITEVM